jgi:hypothetical protein
MQYPKLRYSLHPCYVQHIWVRACVYVQSDLPALVTVLSSRSKHAMHGYTYACRT